MTEQPAEQQTIQVLVALLPNNKVLLQITMSPAGVVHVELDRAGALQISQQLAEMARKLDSEQ